MSEAFYGEIRMFAGNFAPRFWALCNGALMSTANNDALFSLLGTFYGGDGRTTFGLPDMRGRIPLHFGTGPGLTPRPIGERSGQEAVTLTTATMPAHSHSFNVSTDAAYLADPVMRVLGALPTEASRNLYVPPKDITEPVVSMSSGAISSFGAGEPHANIMPVQCINFIIAVSGYYPSRN